MLSHSAGCLPLSHVCCACGIGQWVVLIIVARRCLLALSFIVRTIVALAMFTAVRVVFGMGDGGCGGGGCSGGSTTRFIDLSIYRSIHRPTDLSFCPSVDKFDDLSTSVYLYLYAHL